MKKHLILAALIIGAMSFHPKLANATHVPAHTNVNVVELAERLIVLEALVATLQADVTANTGNIATNTGNIATNATNITALQSGIVPGLGDFVEVIDVPTDLNGDGDTDDTDVDLTGDGVGDADELLPTVRIVGANLQIVNDHPSQKTNSLNALGNLIIGYNEPRGFGPLICSDGAFTNQTDCEAAGFIWAQSHKSGSHNLVGSGGINFSNLVGNSYSSYGGLVVGQLNVINREFASVSGGLSNTASGKHSSVSGGFANTASGLTSSISGGRINMAIGPSSSVSGGISNTASGFSSSISGGDSNTTNGGASSISGGNNNNALEDFSSVSGGQGNTASGGSSSVSGGLGRTAPGFSDWVAGSLFEDE